MTLTKNKWEKYFSGNDVQDLSVSGLKRGLSYIFFELLKYCALTRVPIYRFPSLSYLCCEVEKFESILNKNNKIILDWIIKEMLSGFEPKGITPPTLLDKCLELRIHRPEKITKNLLDMVKIVRIELMKGRTKKDIYILDMDIVGSGKYTREERALYGFPKDEDYYRGLHLITGIFSLIKEKIESNNGFVFSEEGDAILAVFDQIGNAVFSAYLLQSDLKKARDIIEYRIGIGKGNLCVINGKAQYSYSIVEAKRVASKIIRGGVIISQNCFCDLIKESNSTDYCTKCKNKKNYFRKRNLSEDDKTKLQECGIISKNKWPKYIPLHEINIPIMPRGVISLKHTSHHLFEVLIGGELWVVL